MTGDLWGCSGEVGPPRRAVSGGVAWTELSLAAVRRGECGGQGWEPGDKAVSPGRGDPRGEVASTGGGGSYQSWMYPAG